MKKIIITIFVALVVCSCEQPATFERVNPNDPSSSFFTPDSIEDFSLSILNDHIALEWKLGSNFIEGYLLEKTDVNGTFREVATLDIKDTTYKDREVSPFTGEYRIQYIDTSNNSTLIQEYDINPSNFSIINYQNDGIELQWNKNSYFESMVELEWKANSDPYKKIATVSSSQQQYHFTDFDQKSIGTNKFRLVEYSEVDDSGSLTTSEVRLPVWKYPGTVRNAENTGYMIRHNNTIYCFIYDFGFGYQSYKFNLVDFNAKVIQSPPMLDNNDGISSLDVIGEKILALGNSNKYAIYDLKSDNWSTYQDSLLNERAGPSRITLDNHRLLISGGAIKTANGDVLTSALIYNVATNNWSKIANLKVPRYEHMSIELDNGKLFVAGNRTERHMKNSAEIYNPDTDQWQLVDASPITPYLITKLSNGKILAVSKNKSIEFDPSNSSWENEATYELGDHITKSITAPTLYSLPGGNAILAGMVKEGIDNTSGEGNRCQIYIAEKQQWFSIGNLNFHIENLAFSTILDNGDFLIVHRENWQGIPYEILEYSKFR